MHVLPQEVHELDVDVEVLIDGDWVPSRAHRTRRGADGPTTLVSWVAGGERRQVRESWVQHRHIRAVHVPD
jgi:hypothetical protein